MHRVDIRFLKKQCYLACKNKTLSWTNNVGENTGSITIEVHDEYMILRYSTASDTIKEKVTISKGPCNFGGFRRYLICPGCGKKVVTLYGGEKFRCRHCYDFCYSSQLERAAFRLSRKARKLADKVAGDDKDYWRLPVRQPHKLRKKHERLRQEHERILREAWSHVAHYAPDMECPLN